MNYFINLENGVASLNTYRLANAQVTDMADIINQSGDVNSETLTTSLNVYLEDCTSILIKRLSESKGLGDYDTFKNYILSDDDFLDSLCGSLGIDHTEDPEIRAYHLGLFDDYSYERYGQPAY